MYKLSRIINITLFLIFIFGFFLVKNTLSTDEIAIEDRKPQKKVEAVTVANVYLKIVAPNANKTYELRMDSTNSINDMLERARAQSGLAYEKYAYIYGTELDYVENIYSGDTKGWNVYETQRDGTRERITLFLDKKIVDDATYEIVLEDNT